MVNANGVWALVECQHGELRDGAIELVCQGRKIADKLGRELAAVITEEIDDNLTHLLARLP